MQRRRFFLNLRAPYEKNLLEKLFNILNLFSKEDRELLYYLVGFCQYGKVYSSSSLKRSPRSRLCSSGRSISSTGLRSVSYTHLPATTAAEISRKKEVFRKDCEYFPRLTTKIATMNPFIRSNREPYVNKCPFRYEVVKRVNSVMSRQKARAENIE